MNKLYKILFFTLIAQSLCVKPDEDFAALVGECAMGIGKQDTSSLALNLLGHDAPPAEELPQEFFRGHYASQYMSLIEVAQQIFEVKDPRPISEAIKKILETVRTEFLIQPEYWHPYWDRSQYLQIGKLLVDRLNPEGPLTHDEKESILNILMREVDKYDPFNFTDTQKKFNNLFRAMGRRVPGYKDGKYFYLLQLLSSPTLGITPEYAFQSYLDPKFTWDKEEQNSKNLQQDTVVAGGSASSAGPSQPFIGSASLKSARDLAEKELRETARAESHKLKQEFQNIIAVQHGKFPEDANFIIWAWAAFDKVWPDINAASQVYIDLVTENFNAKVVEFGGAIPNHEDKHHDTYRKCVQRCLRTATFERFEELANKWVNRDKAALLQELIQEENLEQQREQERREAAAEAIREEVRVRELHERFHSALATVHGDGLVPMAKEHPRHDEFAEGWGNMTRMIADIIDEVLHYQYYVKPLHQRFHAEFEALYGQEILQVLKGRPDHDQLAEFWSGIEGMKDIEYTRYVEHMQNICAQIFPD